MTDLLTAGGLILTVLLAYLQIQKNQAATIKAQEAHLRNELKVSLYEKASSVFHDATQGLLAATSAARAAIWQLELIAKGMPAVQDKSATDLSNLQYEAQRGISKVLITLEQYEIVFSRFQSIRRQLAEEHQKLLDTHNAFWVKILPYVPLADQRTGQTIKPVSVPNQSQVAELQQLFDAYNAVSLDLSSYILDLQIEAQNELLGELFAKQLPPRSPLDKSLKVLARDPTHAESRPPGRLV